MYHYVYFIDEETQRGCCFVQSYTANQMLVVRPRVFLILKIILF